MPRRPEEHSSWLNNQSRGLRLIGPVATGKLHSLQKELERCLLGEECVDLIDLGSSAAIILG